jgi:hypothetical protein
MYIINYSTRIIVYQFISSIKYVFILQTDVTYTTNLIHTQTDDISPSLSTHRHDYRFAHTEQRTLRSCLMQSFHLHSVKCAQRSTIRTSTGALRPSTRLHTNSNCVARQVSVGTETEPATMLRMCYCAACSGLLH